MCIFQTSLPPSNKGGRGGVYFAKTVLKSYSMLLCARICTVEHNPKLSDPLIKCTNSRLDSAVRKYVKRHQYIHMIFVICSYFWSIIGFVYLY